MMTLQAEAIPLRSYRRADLDAMVQLDELCFEEEFRFPRRVMQEFAEAENARVVIAEADEELAGFAILHVERSAIAAVGYVVTLDVAAAWRKQGLARRLMVALEDAALAERCSAMALHVYPGNKVAVRFYERMGYTYVREAAGFYGNGVDAWVYRKALQQPAATSSR